MLKRFILMAALVLAAMPALAQPAAFGTITANGGQVCAPLTMGIPSVSVQLTGTWTATVTFQGTADGSTYVSVLTGSVTASTTQTTATANGVYTISNPGLARICATATAFTSGTINVVIVNGSASGGAGGGGGGGGAVTQGTVPWVVGFDGTAQPVSQSGTWTVQPGNTANTTPWLVQGALSANGQAAAANRVATLPCIAVSSNPSNTNGRDAPCYTNLTGGLLTQLQQPDGTAVTLANDPCGSTTKTQAVIDNSAASGNSQIVALSGSTVIYVCSIDVTAEATVDMRLVYGTGSACATGETGLTGLYAFSTTTGLLGINKGSGGYYVYKTAAGNALCLETSGAVQINGSVTYVQQ